MRDVVRKKALRPAHQEARIPLGSKKKRPRTVGVQGLGNFESVRRKAELSSGKHEGRCHFPVIFANGKLDGPKCRLKTNAFSP